METRKKHLLYILFSQVILTLVVWNNWEYKFGIGDAVAQFFPVAALSVDHWFHLELPLFNYYQHLGIPIMGFAYYPVLNPFFILSYSLSKFIFGHIQETWNIFCFIHIYISAVGFYLLISYITQKHSLVSVIGSISFSYSGIIVVWGNEWFYLLAVFSYLPFVILYLIKSIENMNFKNSLLLSVFNFLLLTSSNSNFVFYAYHLLGIIGAVFWFKHKRNLYYLFNSKFLFFLIMNISLLIPYLYLNIDTMRNSVRWIGKVPLDIYYGIYSSKSLIFSFASFFPLKNNFSLSSTYGLYFVGSLTFVFLLLLPYILYKYKFRKYRVLLIALLFASILFALLSLGPDGYLAALLYEVSPYNFFQHSFKWLPFYQISILMTAYIIGSLFFNDLKHKKILISLYFLQLVLYSYYICIYDNKGSQRLTDVSFPIQFDSSGLDKNYRTTGIWHKGDRYKTRYTETLLGHNYASLFKMPTIAGYELLVLKNNARLVENGHPGYYTDAENFPLDRFIHWGLKYILVPEYQSDEVLNILKKKYPDINLIKKDVRTYNHGLTVRILEVQSVNSLVFNGKNEAVPFQIKGNSVEVQIPPGSDHSVIVFSWLANPDFHVYLNKTEIPWKRDIHSRVLVQFNGHGTLLLKYEPPVEAVVIFYSGIILFIISVLYFIYSERLSSFKA